MGRPKEWKKKEKWKRVIDYKGLYSVSNMGRVRKNFSIRRYARKYTVRGNFPKVSLDNGIARVNLRDAHGKTQRHSLRKLVADHWMRPRNAKHRVELKVKRDPFNCSIYNLREIKSVKVGNHKLTDKEKCAIRQEYKVHRKKWGLQTRLAKKYDVTQQAISLVLKNEP